MPRPFNPADLISLLVLQARVPPNLAWSGETLASGVSRSLPLASLVGEWFPGRNGRHTWVLSRRGIALGVVSARRRRGQGSWEIDRLQIARGKELASVEALDGLNVTLGRRGAERLLLRLAEESPMEEAAQQAGFRLLLREELYLRPAGRLRREEPLPLGDAALRPAMEADSFNLFRLYNTLVPSSVRQAEGLALRDWQGIRDISKGGPLEEAFVIERDGELMGGVTVSRGRKSKRLVDLLARPEEAVVGPLLEAAVRSQGQRRALVCLLPEYLWSTVSCLEEQGFHYRGNFCLYEKRVVARVRRPGLLPVGA